MKYKVSQPLNMLPHKYHDDPFFGDPSPELDKRWLDRLKCELTKSQGLASYDATDKT